MSILELTYDPWRGGFCVQWGEFSRAKSSGICGDALCVFLAEDGRVAAVESFWDHGGLPLLGIHGAASHPQGEFAVQGPELSVGALQLRQVPQQLELWFGGGSQLSQEHQERWEDGIPGITLTFSGKRIPLGKPIFSGGGKDCPLVAGITFEFARIVADYPLTFLKLLAEDFK